MAVQLYVHSDYSLLESVLTVETLVTEAAKLGIKTLALTDHHSTAGHGELEWLCSQAGIKPIFGLELDVAYSAQTAPSVVVVLARTNQGYTNLLRLASQTAPVSKELLVSHKEGLALLEGGPRGQLAKFLQAGRPQEALALHSWYEKEFAQAYYLRHEVGQDCSMLDAFPLAQFVLCQDVRYKDPKSLLALEVLAKIGGRAPILPTHHMLSWENLQSKFTGPASVLETTLKLAASCEATLPREKIVLPHPRGDNLEELVWQGAKRRYREPSLAVKERLTHELSVIKELDYNDYFLIVADIVRFAKEAKIPVGPGRGSSASSLVAYVLGITEVDPLPFGLLFERFLNVERKKKPDIDLDFCYERRGEVLGFAVHRFGRNHVAQIGTYGTFGPKSAKQEVERILGKNNGLVANEIQGLKRNRSTHAAGVIITAKPTQEISAVYRDREIPVTHLDMYALENLGVLKIDLLGLRTLSLLDKMEKQVQKHKPDFSLTEIPLEDPGAFKMLSEGKTLGIFQLESDLFKELLRALKPNSFRDLTALLALGRPGPLRMFPEYIKGRENPAQIEYTHPLLREILGETYGLILYQEQVMLVSQLLAGLSLGEADLLRSALGKNDPKATQIWQERFVVGAQSVAGLSKNEAEDIFKTMVEFSGYAFNKAHSVSYALITWQAAFLKANYPGEFFLTLLNEGKTGKDLSLCLLEAQSLGLKILPPHLRSSERLAHIEDDGLRLGLQTGRQISPHSAETIMEGRKARAWTSLKDLQRRLGLDGKVLETLVLNGSLDELGSRNSHLEELGLKPKPELKLLQAEKELVGIYASAHPSSPFLPLARQLQGEWDVKVGEILEIKTTGNTRQGVMDTPEGIFFFQGALNLRGHHGLGARLALFGQTDENGIWQVKWALPLGPTLLLTPEPSDLSTIKTILDGEYGLKPTILRIGGAYHLLPQQFWIKDSSKIVERLRAEQLVYTWFDPWKENV